MKEKKSFFSTYFSFVQMIWKIISKPFRWQLANPLQKFAF